MILPALVGPLSIKQFPEHEQKYLCLVIWVTRYLCLCTWAATLVPTWAGRQNSQRCQQQTHSTRICCHCLPVHCRYLCQPCRLHPCPSRKPVALFDHVPALVIALSCCQVDLKVGLGMAAGKPAGCAFGCFGSALGLVGPLAGVPC